MYRRIAYFMVRIRAGINFLMSIIKSINLISVHFWTYLKRLWVSSLVVFSVYVFFFFFRHKNAGCSTTGISHFTLADVEGWTDGRSHDHVITKISRIDRLPHFLTNGAPRARSSAIIAIFISENWHIASFRVESLESKPYTCKWFVIHFPSSVAHSHWFFLFIAYFRCIIIHASFCLTVWIWVSRGVVAHMEPESQEPITSQQHVHWLVMLQKGRN